MTGGKEAGRERIGEWGVRIGGATAGSGCQLLFLAMRRSCQPADARGRGRCGIGSSEQFGFRKKEILAYACYQASSENIPWNGVQEELAG